MGTLRTAFISLILSFSFLLVMYVVERSFAALNKDFSWKEMDWNQDGSTSIFEFIEASDVGKRTITLNGKVCTEYFSLKDGLAIKTVNNQLNQ